ncbi:unnamed protein product [Schistocephalus solidus]|uniref:Uncharacterized protein n=1 Tax=Schistocephalus solidus TaxID=70667 RepID=A0A183S7F6_SCHSO|nr:unnamed protein product [Schistocephalus solidus]
MKASAELAQLAEQVASLQEPKASSSRNQLIATARHVQPSSSRPTSAATCWYRATFGAKARRCISPCAFVSQQSKRVKWVNQKVNVTNATGVPSPGPADRRCPKPDPFLQTVNTSRIATVGTRSISLDIGLQRVFSWVFVVTDIPYAILDADFLASFDLMVDCRYSRLRDQTTKLAVRDTHSSKLGSAQRPHPRQRDAGVAFAIQTDIMGRLPCPPQGTNDRLMSLRLPLQGDKFVTTLSICGLQKEHGPLLYCDKFGLTMNTEQTVVMHQPPQPPKLIYNAPYIRVNCAQLKVVDTFTYRDSSLS